MRTSLTAIFALALTLGSFAGTVEAQPRGGGYVAALASPIEAPRQQIVSGVLWKCSGQQCAAPSQASRPLLVCQRVAKAFGEITRFSSPSGDLSAEELSRCNGQG